MLQAVQVGLAVQAGKVYRQCTPTMSTQETLLPHKDELLDRVQDLNQELQDWRQRLNEQVKSYQVELGSTRNKVATDIDSLRKEFLDLRNSLRQQMDQTWAALGKPMPIQDAQTSGFEPAASQAPVTA